VPLAKLDVAEVVRAVDVDLGGSLRMIRACAPHIRRAGGGSIVNFGSASADAADPDLLVYMAAKVSIAAYTRALARELGPKVRINCVAPGAIATDWVTAWKMPAKERRSLERATCVGRLGEAQDVANLVAFLVSDEASYLTGQTIALDGGMFTS
jgi:3-oxoacyl-[acyl-carrier protein] reductase